MNSAIVFENRSDRTIEDNGRRASGRHAVVGSLPVVELYRINGALGRDLGGRNRVARV